MREEEGRRITGFSKDPNQYFEGDLFPNIGFLNHLGFGHTNNRIVIFRGGRSGKGGSREREEAGCWGWWLRILRGMRGKKT